MDTVPLSIVPSGEDLCLDYANTLCWRGSAVPAEALSGLNDLLNWLGGSAGMPQQVVEEAREWALDDPDRTARLFSEAIALREATYRLFAAVASGDPVAEDDLTALNDGLAAAPARARLVRREGGYAWAAERLALSAPGLLAPVLWSAADLLAGIDRRRIRRCANNQCLWLFIDHSKGGTRRWCDMSSCGNRAKSRRHYLRTKPAATSGP
jgi:predicted RNA-binding Zn ribbon-like protein